MKKIKYLIIMFVMILTLTGCAEKNIEGSLSEVMDKMYANISEENKPKHNKFNHSGEGNDF